MQTVSCTFEWFAVVAEKAADIRGGMADAEL